MAHEFRYLFTPHPGRGPDPPEPHLLDRARRGHGRGRQARPAAPRLPRGQGARRRAPSRSSAARRASIPRHRRAAWNMLANHDDSIIPAYRAMAEAIHRHDCLVFTQLTHMGRRSQSDNESWHVLLAPSQIPEKVHREIPHEMDAEQIAMIVRAFGDAVRRCREGGLDGVELSFAHNHLVDQFWSPALQPADGRVRREPRQPDALRLRGPPRDPPPGRPGLRGRRPHLGRRVHRRRPHRRGHGGDRAPARRLGARRLPLDHRRGRAHLRAPGGRRARTCRYPNGVYVPLAAAIKAAVPEIPIFHATRIVDPVHADQILADGSVDVVGMTRALIADPDMPRKAREGRLDEIRQCVGANEGCIDRIYQGKPVTCIQNPGAGREAELGELSPAATRKRVVVVGGGVGGLETARVAALRGHRWSSSRRAGSSAARSSSPPARPPARTTRGSSRFLVRQVERQGVDCRLSTEADVDAVLAERARRRVVATGSHALRAGPPGARRQARRHRPRRAPRPGRGRGARGRRGRRPHPAGALDRRLPARAAGGASRWSRGSSTRARTSGSPRSCRSTRACSRRACVFTPHTDLVAVEGSTVVVANVYTGEERRIEGVDTVVLSMGARSTDALYRALRGRVPALHAVGDCVAPRGVHHAILEGTRVARVV